MILDLLYYGDPRLRQKALPVETITDEIRKLSDDLIETMLHYKGIGLAATQVGHFVRIFVSNVDYEDDKGEIHLTDPKVYINPVLTNPSHMFVERSEGCLSIPKLYVAIPRPLTVDVEAMDLEGNFFRKSCYGYLARNMMHENDHLNGVLFIDRVKGKRRTEIEPTLRQIKQQYFHS